MNIEDALLAEHSKAQTLRICQYIGDQQDRFDELMRLFFKGEYRVTQRAAWVISYCAEAYPELIEPHQQAMLNNLEKEGLHDAIKRNTLKVLAARQLPEELLGQAATLSFDFLADPQEAIAIKVFAMEMLSQICLVEPGLAGELRLLIEDQMPHASAGFKARGKRILKKLPPAEMDYL